MEIVKAKMSKELYFSLPQDVRDQIDISDVFEDSVDYSTDPTWIDLRYESSKAYKNLKKREYEIRQKSKK